MQVAVHAREREEVREKKGECVRKTGVSVHDAASVVDHVVRYIIRRKRGL